MRLSIPFSLFFIALMLSACDSAEPGSADALVGSWTSEVRYSGFAATSRIDQEVADFTVQGRGGIEISGDVETTLRYTHYAYPDQETNAQFGTHQQNVCGYQPGCAPFAQLRIWPDTDGIVFSSSYDQREYTATATQANLDLQRTETGYSLAPLQLRSEQGGLSVTAGGEIEFQTVQLRAGRPTPVATFHSSPDFGEYEAYDFRSDGTFDYSIAYPHTYPSTASGTWSVTAPGVATLTTDRWTRQAAFEVRDRKLWIVFPLDETPGSSERRVEAEHSIFADEGSLEAASGGGVTVLRQTD